MTTESIAWELSQHLPDLNGYRRIPEELALRVIAVLREPEGWRQVARLLLTIEYLCGIAERGEKRLIREDETVEQFVLGYVKRLESRRPERELTGMEADLVEVLRELVKQHEEGFWSSWQTTAHFEKPLEFARALLAKANNKEST